MPIAADCHYDIHHPAASVDVELIRTVLDTLNGLLLRESPTCAIRVYSANVRDSFVRVIAVRFDNARNLCFDGHRNLDVLAVCPYLMKSLDRSQFCAPKQSARCVGNGAIPSDPVPF